MMDQDAESVRLMPGLSMEYAEPIPASLLKGCLLMVDVSHVENIQGLKEMEDDVVLINVTFSHKAFSEMELACVVEGILALKQAEGHVELTHVAQLKLSRKMGDAEAVQVVRGVEINMPVRKFDVHKTRY